VARPFRPSYPWIGLIAGPLAALASFLIAYFINPLGFGGSNALAAVPALLLAIVFLLIGQNVAAYRELERAANQSREIYEAVKDYLHVTKVGSPERAIRYVTSRLPSAQEIRNTSFNLHDQTDRATDVFYETDGYDAFASGIGKWTSKGGRWRDVGDTLAVDRFRQIAGACQPPKDRRNYQYRLLGQSEPQLNFLILDYPDGTAEVLFNWDFRSFGQDPVVLLSRDRDIIEMFTIQFEHLWRLGSPDHDAI
jgi:hypothetical protein